MRASSSYKSKQRSQGGRKRHSNGGQKRRVRTPWLDYEIQNLIIGVYNFGVGKWAIIHSQMSFQKNRTYIDLKDKWRNLIDHRPCSRTSTIYRALASIIQKRQHGSDHISPDRILGKNDWQVLVQMFYSNIQDEIQSNGSRETIADSSTTSDDIEYKNPVEIPRKVEMVQNYPIAATITPTIIHAAVPEAPIIRTKLPSLKPCNFSLFSGFGNSKIFFLE